MNLTHSHKKDQGSILPMVMFSVFLVAALVLTISSYVLSDVSYSVETETRADRLASADGAMRYSVENLRNFRTLCTTDVASTGTVEVWAPQINGTSTEVTCQKLDGPGPVQGWGLVLTGVGVPTTQDLFLVKGAGLSDKTKTFSGPVFVQDPSRIDFQGAILLENGDFWYNSSNCTSPAAIPEVTAGYIQFYPSLFRGPSCTTNSWSDLFSYTPLYPTGLPLNPGYTTNGSCRVFYPGRYTTIPLDGNNYFTAGDYIFENTVLDLHSKKIIAGFPTIQGGDGGKTSVPACINAQAADAAANPGYGGATLFLSGTSKVNVDTHGSLEVFRKLNNGSFTSIVAVPSGVTGIPASTLGWNDPLIMTKSGNTNDIAIHGLVWAPNSMIELGNVSNSSNGQLLGGTVVARADVQAPASSTAFFIGVEPSPSSAQILLTTTATKEGRSTTIRVVVEYRPDSGELAINSWRVFN